MLVSNAHHTRQPHVYLVGTCDKADTTDLTVFPPLCLNATRHGYYSTVGGTFRAAAQDEVHAGAQTRGVITNQRKLQGEPITRVPFAVRDVETNGMCRRLWVT